jgi:RNA polymerase sigma-70 factor (family 1)
MVKLDDDVLLLQALQLGDQLAFKSLYNKYNGLLYVHAYKKLGDRELVKDIIQEIFLNIWEKRSTIVVQESLAAYLYQAVRFKVIDLISAKYAIEKYIHFQSFLDSQTTPADYLTRESILTSIIKKEVDSLPPRMREVFFLSRSEHLSHQQIAEKLGITTQSVRSHIKNALRILRVNLGTLYPLVILFFH